MRHINTVVVTDANVLVNLCHIDYLCLCEHLSAYRFVIPEEVLDEITLPSQRRSIDRAIKLKSIGLVSIDNIQALDLFAHLRRIMGKGEAACLAFAHYQGCYLASDEKRIFKRKAIELIGQTRILRTEDLILSAIREGLITATQADQFKQVLAQNKYIMKFGSFRELFKANEPKNSHTNIKS